MEIVCLVLWRNEKKTQVQLRRRAAAAHGELSTARGWIVQQNKLLERLDSRFRMHKHCFLTLVGVVYYL